jgi:hypothetical protein
MLQQARNGARQVNVANRSTRVSRLCLTPSLQEARPVFDMADAAVESALETVNQNTEYPTGQLTSCQVIIREPQAA